MMQELEPIITMENVYKSYRKRKTKEYVRAVDDVSFQIHKGEIVGLLGPNGAGKSTTIKMICGLLIPDTGKITINGIDAGKNRLASIRHISAVLEGNRNIYWRLSVRENLEYFAGNRGMSHKTVAGDIDDLLEQFHLKTKANELVNRLSRGMQQKLAIAVAMLADSEVILLDEPTLGLDVETGYEVREIMQTLVETYNRTIIISTHDMDVVQDICERTIIINDGRIVTDDRIPNLLRLFDVRSYTITLGEPLTEEQRTTLNNLFPMHVYTPDVYQPILEVDLQRSEMIYDLFDVLKRETTAVEAIDRSTIDFEQIFMKIVKGEEGHEIAESS